MTFDYTVEEYSLAIFLKEEEKINKKIINDFFVSKKFPINFLETFVAKKTFKEISFISGLIDKKKKGTKNFVSSDIIFDTLQKYDPNHILLQITKEEVMRYFVDKAKINLVFNKKIIFNVLSNPSPFSLALIYKKEKIKSHTVNNDKLLKFF